MVISGSHSLLGDVRLTDACLSFSQLLQPPPCSHIVVKSLKGLMWDPHLGLIVVMVIRRARMVSHHMVTRKISVKVRCEKAIPRFPTSPRTHAKTANAGSSLGENPIHHRHLESDHLEISLITSWAVAQLETLALPYWAKLWFVLFRASEMRTLGGLVTVLASLVTECLCGQSDHSEEEENLLTSLSTFQGLSFISSSAPVCHEKERLINVPLLEGWSSEGCCYLHHLCVLLGLGIEVPAQPQWSRWYSWGTFQQFGT